MNFDAINRIAHNLFVLDTVSRVPCGIRFIIKERKKRKTNSISILQLEHDSDSEASRTFVFENEGHTLGNVLKAIICR